MSLARPPKGRPEKAWPEKARPQKAWLGPEVLFEDRQLLVVIKPQGYLAQADFSSRLDLLEWCRSYVAEKRPGSGRPYLGLCHRLDRPVGGLMVLAKTSKAAARICAQFRDRSIEKLYAAICLGTPPKGPDQLVQKLIRDHQLTRPAGQGEVGQDCALSYELKQSGRLNGTRVSKLTIKLITGFKHQIRAQLAALGHPIYGDTHYGAPGLAQAQEAIALCSTHLSFIHPISREKLTFDCPPEVFWPFGQFLPDERPPAGPLGPSG
ncbi:MAG: RluA family pseudouridine synthase [Deltaproteobacteria bacterium]|nr:RluA family pseudouridine synthase [Deltaproteobacteria bacterium]